MNEIQKKKFDYEPIIVAIGICVASILLEAFIFEDLIRKNPINFLYIYAIMAFVAGFYTIFKGREKDIDTHVWLIVTVLIPISVFVLSWAEQKDTQNETPEEDDEELMKLIDKYSREKENNELIG